MVSSDKYNEAIAHLKARDSVLERIIEDVGPCTLKRSTNYFLTLAEAIVWQQLSWSAANKIYDRMLTVMESRRPKPRDVLRVPRRKLLQTGLSRRKIEYLLELAAYFERGRFHRNRLTRMADDEIIETLTKIRGIGRWTAEMFLVFGLNRMDVFPAGDLGLKKALGRLYGMDGLPTNGQLDAITQPWRPYRTVGAWYLWESFDKAPMRGGG